MTIEEINRRIRGRKVDQKLKDKYIGRAEFAASDWDELIDAINKEMKKYGVIHNQFTQGMLTIPYTKKEKESIKTVCVNLTTAHLDQMVELLKGIKAQYISKAAPSKDTTDQKEIFFIEKELAVMTLEELEEYYMENYLDVSIARLCKIEYKKRRSAHKTLYSVLFSEDVLGTNDNVTEFIDQKINEVIALRQLTGTMFTFMYETSEDSEPVVKMVSWDVLFREVEANAKHSRYIDFSYFIQNGMA